MASIVGYLKTVAVALLLMPSAVALAAEPSLDLTVGGEARHLTRNALLANPALQTIEVVNDAAYHRTLRLQALPLSVLIRDAAQIASLQFTAADGFVANIPGATLAGPGQAWLAIEPADQPWPPLKPGGTGAGTFYLVWLSPEKAGISPEQWPYQIVKISVAPALEIRYPQILPKTVSGGAEQRGFQVYAANCAACHQINGCGDAAIGPDLNLPGNPTEYFRESYLRKLIRNPASVRNWPQRIMPGFSDTVLTDAKLNDLIAYLRQMAKQRH